MNVGIISEGYTDQLVLDNIIIGYFGSDDCVDVKYLQPLRDETDLSAHDGGGWANLIDYCSAEERINSALTTSDYIVIHLDTDILSNLQTDVTGNESVEELVEKAKNVLIERIAGDLYSQNAEKILFAISVHSIECWILVLLEDQPKRRNQTVNCLDRVNRKLSPRGYSIDPRNKNHFKDEYHELSEEFSNKRTLKRVKASNDSLSIFFDAMDEKWSSFDSCVDT